ncbi:PLP-dependent transferase [Streptomyces asiaticus]
MFVNSREWLAQDLPDFGCEVTFVDLTDLKALEAAFRPTTRAVFFEEFTNPLLDVLDIEAIVAIAHDHDALACADPTARPRSTTPSRGSCAPPALVTW